MKNFMDNDFLLKNKTAQILYHTYAKNMPIFDFHCRIYILVYLDYVIHPNKPKKL